MGFTLTYLTLLVLIPVSMVFLNSAQIGLDKFWEIVSSERVLASLKISFGTSFLAAAINVVFGLLLAWVLERYDFWGKKLVDGLIDLPFALPPLLQVFRSQLYIPEWLDWKAFRAVWNQNIIYSPGYSCCLGFHRIPLCSKDCTTSAGKF